MGQFASCEDVLGRGRIAHEGARPILEAIHRSFEDFGATSADHDLVSSSDKPLSDGESDSRSPASYNYLPTREPMPANVPSKAPRLSPTAGTAGQSGATRRLTCGMF
jgi:hypothetical protein